MLPRRFPGRQAGKRWRRKSSKLRRRWRGRLGSGAFVVVVDLVEHAAALGLERAVVDPRRPAGIGRRVEGFAAFALRIVADDEIAGNQIDLLPMVVHERRGREDAGLDPQETGTASHFA